MLVGLALTVAVDSAIYISLASSRVSDEINQRHQLLSKHLSLVIETAWLHGNYPRDGAGH